MNMPVYGRLDNTARVHVLCIALADCKLYTTSSTTKVSQASGQSARQPACRPQMAGLTGCGWKMDSSGGRLAGQTGSDVGSETGPRSIGAIPIVRLSGPVQLAGRTMIQRQTPRIDSSTGRGGGRRATAQARAIRGSWADLLVVLSCFPDRRRFPFSIHSSNLAGERSLRT